MARGTIRPDTGQDAPTSIRIPQDVMADIDREADEQRRSRSWVVVEILRQWQAWKKRDRKEEGK